MRTLLAAGILGGAAYAAAAAAAAAAAGPAGGAIAAAGALARLPVPDEAADQKGRDEGDQRDQRDIDEVGGKPAQHGITSFLKTGGIKRCGEKRVEPRSAHL